MAVLLGRAGNTARPGAPGSEGNEPDRQRGFAYLAAERIHLSWITCTALDDRGNDVWMRKICSRSSIHEEGVLGDYLEPIACRQIDGADNVLCRVGIRIVELDILKTLLLAPLELLPQV